jgi:hypothetical protein
MGTSPDWCPVRLWKPSLSAGPATWLPATRCRRPPPEPTTTSSITGPSVKIIGTFVNQTVKDAPRNRDTVPAGPARSPSPARRSPTPGPPVAAVERLAGLISAPPAETLSGQLSKKASAGSRRGGLEWTPAILEFGKPPGHHLAPGGEGAPDRTPRTGGHPITRGPWRRAPLREHTKASGHRLASTPGNP